MTVDPTDIAYVRGWAWSWATSSRVDRDDVTAYALEALLELDAEYQPERQPWRSFLRFRLPLRVVDLMRRHEGYGRYRPPTTVSLDAVPTGIDDGLALHDRLGDPAAARALAVGEARVAVPQVLAPLPPHLASVLIESYLEGATLAEIGRRRGVTESRASYLRTEALAQARALAAA